MEHFLTDLLLSEPSLFAHFLVQLFLFAWSLLSSSLALHCLASLFSVSQETLIFASLPLLQIRLYQEELQKYRSDRRRHLGFVQTDFCPALLVWRHMMSPNY